MKINYEPHEDKRILRIQHNVNRAFEKLGIEAMQELEVVSSGALLQNLVIKHNLGKTPRGAWLTYLQDKTAGTLPTLGAYLSWQPDANGIRIGIVTGVNDNSIYKVRILVYA